jgi:VIT1/CCC1 family predicted Fe2+/Mn2+ transporter
MTPEEHAARAAVPLGSSHRHRTIAPEPNRARHGTALRAGVLGATDGLVSNLSLVMGIAGSGAGHSVVVIAGLAGLVAGALSMGLGEYLSVQSARELFARELEIEANELKTNPAAEVDELCSIYERKGFPTEQAHELAERIVHGDPKFALDTMAREELGFDPKQLGGSALVAAGTSLSLFALGALVPLLPFLVLSGNPAIMAAATVSGVALFGLGAGITNLTGLNPIRAGLRQLVFGAVAAAITYGIGVAVGGVVR